ncbi:isopentenyl-diphosphate delta-isomerase i [Phtheirospermum japonicum]|uniref:Isopentenyl-diphosphate delta-isomerase i n=1 Tax=Phtheirospermum japonicum TaxID=374723 RepID=A0A830D1Z9_9LAMI|nr:isopentenyl-diphosphate delta-isomerase i [Phtheirospermum japonicum]
MSSLSSNTIRFQNLLPAAPSSSSSPSPSHRFPLKSIIFKPTSTTSAGRVHVSSSYSSVAAPPPSTMGDATADSTMDAVQRRLICILVDENDRVVGHDTKYNWVRNAAQRKLLDELGISADDVPVDQFIPLGRILYKAPSDGKWGEHELDYLLFIVRDVSVYPNPDEVADIKYVNREELNELLRKADAGEEGVKLSPWFRLVVDNFLLKWWDHVEKGTLHEAADMKTIHKL